MSVLFELPDWFLRMHGCPEITQLFVSLTCAFLCRGAGTRFALSGSPGCQKTSPAVWSGSPIWRRRDTNQLGLRLDRKVRNPRVALC
jgi:hypothetical protein